MPYPVITAEQVEHRLDWLDLIDAIEAGHQLPRAQQTDAFLQGEDQTMLTRCARVRGLGMATKTVSVVPGNPARGLPSIHGAMVLFDDETAQVEAIIDNALVTKWKTAADSLLGARFLARSASRSLLIVGAGTVAESLCDSYRALFPKIEISIWNRNPDRAKALAERKSVAMATELSEAVASADIVACATMAQSPVLQGDWLRKGTHVDLIGAYTPQMREADDEAMRRGRLFVDSRASTIGHIGELMIPLASGTISEADIRGDFYDLAAGNGGRESADDITVFKNGGGAHLDLMTGRYILSAWRAKQAES